MSDQLALDVELVSPGVTHGYCGVPGCGCGLPKLPDTGWRAKRELVVAERAKADAA